ncbi:MAG: hypothetical protein J0G29_01245 [Alphaproteobacteria bacterium]|nr:hypothetical protein [Alphaproteobacteria bacterium]OJV47063.1 MAG: hypothetical protein BGO28_01280 [Alphaproteobacteria bacterium 43-37]
MRITLMVVLLVSSLSSFDCQAGIHDYAIPEEELQVAPGVIARSSAIASMKELNITERVVELYKSFKPTAEKGSSVSVVQDDCFALFIVTQDGVPSFLMQLYVKDRQKCNNTQP